MFGNGSDRWRRLCAIGARAQSRHFLRRTAIGVICWRSPGLSPPIAAPIRLRQQWPGCRLTYSGTRVCDREKPYCATACAQARHRRDRGALRFRDRRRPWQRRPAAAGGQALAGLGSIDVARRIEGLRGKDSAHAGRPARSTHTTSAGTTGWTSAPSARPTSTASRRCSSSAAARRVWALQPGSGS